MESREVCQVHVVIGVITGIKALLLVVAGLYLLALAAQRVMVRALQTKTFAAPAPQLTAG